MTNNIGIDLDAIPHPKDCHPVPIGETIRERTQFWSVSESGRATWFPHGLDRVVVTNGADGKTYLVPKPIIPHPTPDDSPIIITGTSLAEVDLGATAFAVWAHGTQDWRVTTDYGGFLRLNNEQVTDWLPVVVTATEPGIWDERDKRARLDADGDTWYWDSDGALWECDGRDRGCFGSLNAFRKWYDEYLVGFADEQGGEE